MAGTKRGSGGIGRSDGRVVSEKLFATEALLGNALSCGPQVDKPSRNFDRKSIGKAGAQAVCGCCFQRAAAAVREQPSVKAAMGSGGEDRALVKAMVGLRVGKKPRQIAVDIHGADEVAAEWYSDGRMRFQVRRWIDKASVLVGGCCRDFGPRNGREE